MIIDFPYEDPAPCHGGIIGIEEDLDIIPIIPYTH